MSEHPFHNTRTAEQQFKRGFGLMGINRPESIAGMQGKYKTMLLNLLREGDLGVVYKSMLWLATECPDYKTRRQAAVDFLIIMTGKPTETVLVQDSNTTLAPQDIPAALDALKYMKASSESSTNGNL